ncbi:hypothetical protein NIES2100_48950 [Calothrix sp. NIES-2100]|nr:hypothetical protein NIES2100_48950 [Calothrix sp. NIES-2100]
MLRMKLQQAWVDDVKVTFQGQQLECDRFFKLRVQVVNSQ